MRGVAAPYHVKGGPRAAKQTRDVVQGVVAVALVLKQFHVGVEKIALGDVDALHVELVDEL